MGDTTYLTLGRGRLYWAPFDANGNPTKDELFFGNTPEVSLAIANTMLDHYDSDNGIKLKDLSMILESVITGTVQADQINSANLANWALGVDASSTVAAASNITETIVMRPGYTYQLGVSTENPTGLMNLSTLVLTKGVGSGAVPCVLGTDYTFDAANGRVTTLPGSAVITQTAGVGVSIHCSYAQVAFTRDQIISEGLQIYGSLRYISNNPVGPNRNFFMPHAILTSDGTFALKGDQFQILSFKVEALLPTTGYRMYLDGNPVAG